MSSKALFSEEVCLGHFMIVRRVLATVGGLMVVCIHMV